MTHNTLPSEYLIHDPQDAHPMPPDPIPKCRRLIDFDTRVDLVGVLNELLGVCRMVSGTPPFKKLAAQMETLVAIISEGAEGAAL